MNIFSGLYLDPITLNPVNIEPFNPFLVPNIVNIVEPLNVPFMDGVQISGQADKVKKAKEILTNYSKQLVMASKNWKYERKDGKIVLIQKNADGSTNSYNGSGCLLINVDTTSDKTLELDDLSIILVRNKTTTKWEDMGGGISDKIQPPTYNTLLDNARKELMEESAGLFFLDSFSLEQNKYLIDNNIRASYISINDNYFMNIIFVKINSIGDLQTHFEKNQKIINSNSVFSNEWKETNEIRHIKFNDLVRSGYKIKSKDGKDEDLNNRTKNTLNEIKNLVDTNKLNYNDGIKQIHNVDDPTIKYKVFEPEIKCERDDLSQLNNIKICYADLDVISP